MRLLAVLTVCLLALVPAFDSAMAAGGKGSVSRSWISQCSCNTSEKSFSASKVKRLYANFIWKVPAAAGQVLKIEWRDPKGELRAVWTDTTIKKDQKGTRLFAWVASSVVKGTPGSWNAYLTVGGTRIGGHKFRVVA